MTVVCPVSPAFVLANWGESEPKIARVFEKMPLEADCTIEELLAEIQSDRVQCWVINDIQAVALTMIKTEPERHLFVYIVDGDGQESWFPPADGDHRDRCEGSGLQVQRVPGTSRLGKRRPHNYARGCGWVLVCALLVACSVSKEREALPPPPEPGPLGWEAPPPFSAQPLLPVDWIKGPHHLVQDEVLNDGAQHHFVVTSDFGIFPAAGVAMLRARIRESEAIAELKDARKSEVFAEALAFQLLHPLRGVKMLIMEPGRVVSGVGGGLLEFLAMPGRASKFEWSDREDSVTKATIGFSYLKRKLAFQFGVDPYSSNAAVQDELNELTWTAFPADLAPQFGYLFMPGGAVLWMSFSD